MTPRPPAHPRSPRRPPPLACRAQPIPSAGVDRRPVEDARHLGREVPAAGQQLARGPSAIDLAAAQQHDPVGEGGGELDVVGRDHDRRAASRELAASAARSSLRARSMPRVGSSSSTAPGGSPAPRPGPRPRSPAPGAGARRPRGRGGPRPPGRRGRAPQRRRPASAGSSSPTRSRTSRSPGRCGSSATPARVRRLPRRSAPPVPRPRAQQRALAGAVAPHQRHPLARADLEVEPAQGASILSAPSPQLHPGPRPRGRSPRDVPRPHQRRRAASARRA